MNYNICIIKPDGYIHSQAFLELAQLLYFSLNELGHSAAIQINQLEEEPCKNILIGCHLLQPELIETIPKSTVILNTEQLYADATAWNADIFRWAENFEVWDYSNRNILKFDELGIKNVRHLQLGFQKELARIEKASLQDIDVLFYGSPNERRQKILAELKERGLIVHAVSGTYGKERDQLVGRSKVVLNHHFYDAHIFEIVRVFYLMTNSVAVVAEVNESTSIDDVYKRGIYPASYDNLVDACVKLVKDDALRKELETNALRTISRLPQRELTASVLGA